MAKSMQPGGGGRFAAMKKKVAGAGARDPGAVAAAIGVKAHGKQTMESWAKAGKKRAKR